MLLAHITCSSHSAGSFSYSHSSICKLNITMQVVMQVVMSGGLCIINLAGMRYMCMT